MLRFAFALALTAVAALPAQAECYADYKAKQDDPLRLHYGVAEAELAHRLEASGWVLLNVLSVFGPEGLEERKASAADYFLRF